MLLLRVAILVLLRLLWLRLRRLRSLMYWFECVVVLRNAMVVILL